MTPALHPVFLCGGSGTRLWPLSRQSYPKQFAPLLGKQSLFQASVARLQGADFEPPLIITHSDFRFIVTEQLAALDVTSAGILIEPAGRDTAPAVLAAALYVAQTDPEALMLVAPSDHVIPDTAEFQAAVQRARPTAQAGALVTFGIKPDRAETGYGYLELSAPVGNGDPQPLRRFVEKPDQARAADMLAAETFLWNAGIFLFSVRSIIAAFIDHAPDLLPPTKTAVMEAKRDLDFTRLAPEPWQSLRSISLDYAVMEKADNLSVVPYSGLWSDLGSWDAVWSETNPDADGVVTQGPALALDCSDCLLRAESGEQQLVGLGLENVIAVAMPDAVLVADKSRAQDVKTVVSALRAQNAPQADTFPRDHRPWGWFESLAIGDRFQVKRIVVNPGGTLSLQSHVHRAEHWIVVEGTAKVTIKDQTQLISENQSIYIPLGAKHRLENPGKLPVVLIEVQTGSYLGEDDITRYEDVYARSSAD